MATNATTTCHLDINCLEIIWQLDQNCMNYLLAFCNWCLNNWNCAWISAGALLLIILPSLSVQHTVNVWSLWLWFELVVYAGRKYGNMIDRYAKRLISNLWLLTTFHDNHNKRVQCCERHIKGLVLTTLPSLFNGDCFHIEHTILCSCTYLNYHSVIPNNIYMCAHM